MRGGSVEKNEPKINMTKDNLKNVDNLKHK